MEIYNLNFLHEKISAWCIRDEQPCHHPDRLRHGRPGNKYHSALFHAQEFFRNNNYLEEFEEKLYEVRWESERAALLIIGVALNLPNSAETRTK